MSSKGSKGANVDSDIAFNSKSNTNSDKTVEQNTTDGKTTPPSESKSTQSSKAKSAVTVHSKSSKRSRMSAAVMAKAAALEVEARALEEKEALERQLLEIQQKAKRLELKTEMSKLQAEQQVLEEVEDEQAEDEAVSKRSSEISEQVRMERVQNWVDKQADLPRVNATGLDPQAPEYHATLGRDTRNVARQVPGGDRARPYLPVLEHDPNHNIVTGVMEEMLHTFHMPKTEMTFDGEPTKFWAFMKAFDNNVGKYKVDEHAKLSRLLQYCTGRAYQVIEGCAAMNQGGYQRARKLLQERFGDKYAISAAWVKKVTSGARATNESLQEFADEMLSFRETLAAIDCLFEVNQRVLVQIAEKMPVYLQHRWKRQVSKLRERGTNPNIDDLVKFICSAAREVNDPVYGELGTTNKPKPAYKKGFHGATTTGTGNTREAATKSEKTQSRRQCLACHSNECTSLFKCEDFKKLTPDKRSDLAKRHKLCYNCLKGGHSSVECKAESTCTARGCKLKHTKFLHTSQNPRADAEPAARSESVSGSPTSETAVCSYVGTSAPRVALPVVKVRVSDSGQWAETYALLDSGSTNTFCATSLLQRLKSRGQKTSLNLTTLEGQGRKVQTSVHNLQLSDVRGQNKVTVRQVYATPSIPVSKDCFVELSDLGRWEHLKGIQVPELTGDRVEMLIGQDCPELLMPLEVRASEEPGSPYATRTLFGWTINGVLGRISKKSTASVNYISLEQQVERLWTMEGAQLGNTSKGLSVEDRRALTTMEDSIKKEDGHYSIAIPFKENRSSLPNNKSLAESRLKSLARKLEKNPTLRSTYADNMQALVQKGYAEKVPEKSPDEPVEKNTWYIPHHPVINPKKPSKLRVVFDCAARHHGVSLNEVALQGPDFTNKLLGILLRFRQYPVAVSGDIEAMFHQVKVPEEDRDVLRYLWWPDGDSSKLPDTYRMTVHLFGGTWSPSVCSYALQQTARDNTKDFPPEVTDTVLRDFYVDDCLKSFQTEEEATAMVLELPKLLQRGGFRLHKWLSNSKDVLHAIPVSERAVGARDLNLQALPVERTLGVLWDVNNDVFTFSMKQTGRPSTRRGLLGAVCSVYDPMGFVTPFSIRGKKLVQDLAREKVDWDEPLNEQYLSKWQRWLTELDEITEIKIDRCLKPSELEEASRIELHHFSDASTMAYGSASYIRIVDVRQQVRCNLLFSRSRVTPLKKMTIPRLELAAAALSVQQDEMIRSELSLPIGSSLFWTDSTIVLAYIRNQSKRFHTYVANRLAVIHAGSTVAQWKHVRSEDNPADDITRGLSMQDLTRSRRWFHGPEFLLQHMVKEEMEPPSAALENDPEVKHNATTCTTNADVKKDVIRELMARYSSWTRLKRAIAWLLKFKDYLLHKSGKQRQLQAKKGLDAEDLQTAEVAIVRHVQSQEYAEEIRDLHANKIKKRSKIYKLDPTLTSDGVLVCGVRSRRARAGHIYLQPMILPKDHHITTLLARHCHERSGHSGGEYTVTEVQQRYWVPGIRVTVRRVIGQCRKCRRVFSTPGEQRMADLPAERVDTDQPPFTNVGVDCFGPFITKLGRRREKRYGCIFTCLTTRAVHLETLDSMDTSSFINALKRFMSRRGRPKKIISDNGTNFVGAQRELRESLKEWNQQAIDSFLTQSEITWKFNPPGASHMGGAWERLIRSVRRTLAAVMTEQIPNDDSLNTLLCQVEGIINSRPLTTVSDDPSDFEPLTPNHLLLLRPMPILPPGVFDPKDCYVRRRWRQVQYLTDLFWHRWLSEYLPLIQLRTKWKEKKADLGIDDVVLIVDYNAPRNQWQIGRVSEVYRGSDGLVRSAQVRTKTSILTRPVTKLCYLEGKCCGDIKE